MVIKVKKLNDNAVIPVYAKQGDSGFDLVACEDRYIFPSKTALISTGLAFEIPEGYEMQIRPRSGVTAKTGLRVQLGTIDSGYRGEVKVIIDNQGTGSKFNLPKLLDGTYDEAQQSLHPLIDSYLIKKGDRIAQGVIVPVVRAELIETDSLSDSERASGGFGHTGI
jgi:dUTP pyrophosphatase